MGPWRLALSSPKLCIGVSRESDRGPLRSTSHLTSFLHELGYVEAKNLTVDLLNPHEQTGAFLELRQSSWSARGRKIFRLCRNLRRRQALAASRGLTGTASGSMGCSLAQDLRSSVARASSGRQKRRALTRDHLWERRFFLRASAKTRTAALRLPANERSPGRLANGSAAETVTLLSASDS